MFNLPSSFRRREKFVFFLPLKSLGYNVFMILSTKVSRDKQVLKKASHYFMSPRGAIEPPYLLLRKEKREGTGTETRLAQHAS